jgi:pimeloyl-ACP methyl ester carboxylesterase
MENHAKENLVFLPGLVCDRYVWEQPIAGLRDLADCSVVEWATENRLETMAQKVLRTSPHQFGLAGHSMGGRVALEVYRAAPERVSRIALLNTGYAARPADASGEEEERGRLALLDLARSEGMRAMARQWLPPMIHPARRNDATLAEAIVEMFARKTPDVFEAQIQAMLARPDASDVLHSIRCPALLLTGREDGWSPPERHEAMREMTKGSRLVVVADCGHMSTLEQPEAVTKALREWVEW